MNYFKYLKENNPEKLKEIGMKGAITTQKKYPNMGKMLGEYSKKYGHLSPTNFKNLKKNNPKKFEEIHKKAMKGASKSAKKLPHNFKNLAKINPSKLKKMCSKAGKRTQELHPKLSYNNGKKVQAEHRKNKTRFYNKELSSMAGKKGALKSLESLRNNKPYLWKEVHFDSKEEMLVAKLLLKKPIEKINYQIKLKNRIIDFFIDDLLLVEYHYWDTKHRTEEEYRKDRIDAIKNSKFKNIPLYIINKQYGRKDFWKQIKEIKKILLELKNNNILGEKNYAKNFR